MGPQRDLFRFVTHFWSRVDRRGPDDCWPWTASRNVRGYGSLGYKDPETGVKSHLTAHRVAYHLTNGAPPIGCVVMHKCDNPPCCNPSHLATGTVSDNNKDRAAKGRSSHHAPPPGSKRLRGTQHPSCKLTEIEVRIIRELCKEGRLTQRQIAEGYGITQSNVKSIHKRTIWKHVV